MTVESCVPVVLDIMDDVEDTTTLKVIQEKIGVMPNIVADAVEKLVDDGKLLRDKKQLKLAA